MDECLHCGFARPQDVKVSWSVKGLCHTCQIRSNYCWHQVRGLKHDDYNALPHVTIKNDNDILILEKTVETDIRLIYSEVEVQRDGSLKCSISF